MEILTCASTSRFCLYLLSFITNAHVYVRPHNDRNKPHAGIKKWNKSCNCSQNTFWRHWIPDKCVCSQREFKEFNLEKAQTVCLTDRCWGSLPLLHDFISPTVPKVQFLFWKSSYWSTASFLHPASVTHYRQCDRHRYGVKHLRYLIILWSLT